MDRKERLQQIRDLVTGTVTTEGFKAGDSVAEGRGLESGDSFETTKFLLEEIARLEASNKSLADLNRELAQEIENVKADFGNNR